MSGNNQSKIPEGIVFLSKKIKELYNHQCQVCGTVLEIQDLRYAEGAHIKPLDKPHNGEDILENILCLCLIIMFFLIEEPFQLQIPMI
ncbi:HNH endonuclease [Myroides marinus]|uniref:HNH endonuclease n=1 Tax=Myroides marinus TaxID=703342 RepID=UPI002576B3A7|nr:HNH endonuclease [Myroides marinus]